MASDGNGCTDFPSQQKSCVKLADISMLCDNMTRWPLTHLRCLKQLCPKNLCATNVAFLGLPLFALPFLAHSIVISLDVMMAMVAQVQPVDKTCCARRQARWPWHGTWVRIPSGCLGMYLGTLTSAHLGSQQLCPKNLCVTNVAFLGLPSLPCVFWNSIAKSFWVSWWQWLHRLPKSAKELC